ncbi:cytochrome d ubiquinol oxidase subunit II [Haloactinopolyspora sp.]|uniref:cytochrome d ubiquinol oxidase subunit II n=1 Tax=Haloactinopolyspora sp. TaxID=1966353 RepID=UPI00260EFB1B|nr:cytochrome d ubiquinol oxidase subunit II [Haloactinopolyspora sp.]
MALAELNAAVLLLGLTAYAVLGGADFGAGFWDLTAGGARRGARLRGMVKNAMGPVWEANHVWLIFVLVVFWTAFPRAFGPVMQTLYVPLYLAGVGIIFRGAAFALRGEAATIVEARLLGGAFALASVAVPFFLGAVVGAVASGQVPAEGAGDAWESWTGPFPLYIGVLTVGAGAYIAAVFLAGDSVRVGQEDLARAFRWRALAAALVTGVLAIAGLFVARSQARGLYDGLTSGGGVVAVVVSALAGVVALALVWREHYEPARYASAVAVAATVAGWGLAQRPDFLPGALSLDEAAAGRPTQIAILVSMGIALLILAPSLWLLFRLTLAGRLDTDFHPIAAADRRDEP